MFFTKDFKIRHIPSALARLGWAWLQLLRPVKRQRYIQLVPSFCAKQFVWDRRDKRIIKLHIRHSVDFSTLSQVYLVEDYKLWGLKRYDELWCNYEQLIKASRTPLIVDCGGNIGLTSRYFAENFPQAKVVCIEPQPDNIELARSNTQKFNVKCLEAGIGGIAGRGVIENVARQANAFRVLAQTEGELAVVTMDEVLKSESQSVPFIVKIDIEGGEAGLFETNAEWVEKFAVVIIELHDWMMPRSANSRNFLKAISGLKRDLVIGREVLISIRID